MTNNQLGIYNHKSLSCLEGDSDGDTVEITVLLIDWIRVYLDKEEGGDLKISYEHQLSGNSKLSIPLRYIGIKSRISTINIQHINYNQTFFLFESGLYTEGWSILLDAESNIIGKQVHIDCELDEVEEELSTHGETIRTNSEAISTLNTKELTIFLLLKDKVDKLSDLNFQSLLPWNS